MGVKPLSRRGVGTPYFLLVENMNYLSNAHREMEIAIIIEGTVIVTIEGESFECSQGDVVFMNAFDIHSYKTRGSSLLLGCTFRKECSFEIEQQLSEKYPESFVYQNKDNHEKILNLAKWIIDTHDDTTEIQRLAYLLFMFGYLDGDNMTYIQKDKSNQLIVDILQYFDENVDKKLNLNQICHDIGISKYYALHEFKKVIGLTMMDYFMKLKLAGSKRILKETDDDIESISLQLGFGSVRTFNRQFIQNFGMTPSEFRKIQYDKIPFEISIYYDFSD